MSLWAIQGREMYSANDVKIVDESKRTAQKRTSVIMDTSMLENLSQAKQALFVRVPSKKGIRSPTKGGESTQNIAEKIAKVLRRYGVCP